MELLSLASESVAVLNAQLASTLDEWTAFVFVVDSREKNDEMRLRLGFGVGPGARPDDGSAALFRDEDDTDCRYLFECFLLLRICLRVG